MNVSIPTRNNVDVRVHNRLAGGTAIIQADIERSNSETVRKLSTNAHDELPHCGQLGSR